MIDNVLKGLGVVGVVGVVIQVFQGIHRIKKVEDERERRRTSSEIYTFQESPEATTNNQSR